MCGYDANVVVRRQLRGIGFTANDIDGLIQFNGCRSGVTGVYHAVIKSSYGRTAYGDSVNGVTVDVVSSRTGFNRNRRAVCRIQGDRAVSTVDSNGGTVFTVDGNGAVRPFCTCGTIGFTT